MERLQIATENDVEGTMITKSQVKGLQPYQKCAPLAPLSISKDFVRICNHSRFPDIFRTSNSKNTFQWSLTFSKYYNGAFCENN